MAREWNDLTETEIDIDEAALMRAIAEQYPKAGITTPGNEGAVANYKGNDYETWQDLAFAFALPIDRFTR